MHRGGICEYYILVFFSKERNKYLVNGYKNLFIDYYTIKTNILKIVHRHKKEKMFAKVLTIFKIGYTIKANIFLVRKNKN